MLAAKVGKVGFPAHELLGEIPGVLDAAAQAQQAPMSGSRRKGKYAIPGAEPTLVQRS